jgi:predicted nucleic acid-binding protein
VAVLAAEPAAEEVAGIFDAGAGITTAIAVAEALDVLIRVRRRGDERARRAVEAIVPDPIEAIAIDVPIALRAASLRSTHYRRRGSALSLADCTLLAVAADRGLRIATADPPLLRAARAEGLDVRALPDSQGRLPR